MPDVGEHLHVPVRSEVRQRPDGGPRHQPVVVAPQEQGRGPDGRRRLADLLGVLQQLDQGPGGFQEPGIAFVREAVVPELPGVGLPDLRRDPRRVHAAHLQDGVDHRLRPGRLAEHAGELLPDPRDRVHHERLENPPVPPGSSGRTMRSACTASSYSCSVR